MAAGGRLLRLALLTLSALDWVVLVVYLVAVVAFGIWAGRGNRRIETSSWPGARCAGGRWASRSWPPRSAPSPSSAPRARPTPTACGSWSSTSACPSPWSILCVTLVPFFYRARRLHRLRVPGAPLRRPHAHAHEPALPVLARPVGGRDALRAVAGAVRDPGLERAGHHPAHGRLHHRVRGLRREQVGDLDRRRADGASSGSGSSSASGSAIAQLPACRPARRAGPRPGSGRLRSWTPRSASPALHAVERPHRRPRS